MAANQSYTASNSTHTPCPYSGDAAKYAFAVAYCLVLMLSLAGNVLVILSIFKNPRMRTSTNYIIVNMAASDLLLPIFAVPRMIVEVLLGRETWLIDGAFGLVLCKLVYFFQDVSTAVSVQSLVAITVDRFYAVMFPLRAATIMKPKVKFVIPVTWIVALGLHSVYFYTFQLCDVHGKVLCCQTWPSSRSKMIYYLFILIVVFALPLFAIIALYAQILVKLRRRKCPGERSGSTRSQRNERQRQHGNIFRMAVAIVVVFFLCFAPLVVLALLSLQAVHFEKCSGETFRSVAKFLAQSNCALNPLIYFIFSQHFRQGFTKYLSIVFCCKVRRLDAVQSSKTHISLKKLSSNSFKCSGTSKNGLKRRNEFKNDDTHSPPLNV